MEKTEYANRLDGKTNGLQPVVVSLAAAIDNAAHVVPARSPVGPRLVKLTHELCGNETYYLVVVWRNLGARPAGLR